MNEEYKMAIDTYEEELNDVIKYSKMYQMAADPLHRQFYKDIMQDEYNHASILKHMLVKDGIYTSNDRLTKLEDEVNKIHESSFR